MLQLLSVAIDKPDTTNFILGQTHFIKSVEDIHEALVGAVPGIRFGLAFCEASGKRLVRHSGTGAALTELACRNALAIGAGQLLSAQRAERDQGSARGLPDFLRDRQSDRGRRRAVRTGTKHSRRRRRLLAARHRNRRGRALAQGSVAQYRLQGVAAARRRVVTSPRLAPDRAEIARIGRACALARLRACVLAGLRAVRRLRIADCRLSIVDRRLPLRHGVPVRFASRMRAHAIHDIGNAASGRLASHDNAAADPTPARLRLDSGSTPARLRLDSGSTPARLRLDSGSRFRLNIA